jgi:hypothetical protein
LLSEELRKLERAATPRETEPVCGDRWRLRRPASFEEAVWFEGKQWTSSALRRSAKMLLDRTNVDKYKTLVVNWFVQQHGSWYETICEDMMAHQHNPQSTEDLLKEIKYTEGIARKKGRNTSVFISGISLLSTDGGKEAVERIANQLRVYMYDRFKVEHKNANLQEDTWYLVHRHDHLVLAWYGNTRRRKASMVQDQGAPLRRKRSRHHTQ